MIRLNMEFIEAHRRLYLPIHVFNLFGLVGLLILSNGSALWAVIGIPVAISAYTVFVHYRRYRAKCRRTEELRQQFIKAKQKKFCENCGTVHARPPITIHKGDDTILH